MTDLGLTLAEAAIKVELFLILVWTEEAAGLASRLTWKLFIYVVAILLCIRFGLASIVKL